jgi:DNA-binding LacI/PurR family transcriptional regulator
VPALTTLRMPIAEIVAHAVALAVALAREPDAPRGPSLEVFKPTLIVRESTGQRGIHTRIASAPRLAQAK